MSRLLALDQASKTSGWSVFIDGKYHAHGKFTFDDDNIGERLYKIREKVNSLIQEYEINEIVFEDIQLQANVGNNVKTFKTLAEVFGVLEELFAEKGLPHEAVLASSWKSTLGIKGRSRTEQKKNAQNYVLETYGIKATQDECDAICIGAHATKIKTKKFDHDWSE